MSKKRLSTPSPKSRCVMHPSAVETSGSCLGCVRVWEILEITSAVVPSSYNSVLVSYNWNSVLRAEQQEGAFTPGVITGGFMQ